LQEARKMEAMRVYGSSDSGNCLKVKWVAELVGAPYEWIETSSFDGSTRTPAFLALNPAGQVPLVVFADGRRLAQSNAIMLYLAEDGPLAPKDAFARAKMMEWRFWEQYSHEPAIAVRLARRHFLKMREDELDPSLMTKGKAALARMNMHLTEAQYFGGARFNLADIALYAYTRKADLAGFALTDYPAVMAWLSRVKDDLEAGGAVDA
jgi:glutathione S-transferase